MLETDPHVADAVAAATSQVRAEWMGKLAGEQARRINAECELERVRIERDSLRTELEFVKAKK